MKLENKEVSKPKPPNTKDREHKSQLRLPKSIKDASNLYKILSNYIENNYSIVLISFIVSFIFLQSFAIPGSIPMALLGGALFKTKIAVTVISFSTAIGATNCYMLSYYFGRAIIHKYMHDRLVWYKHLIQKHSSHLTRYIIILRLTPIFPGWFLNIAAPHINIPLKDFFIGTVVGVIPTTVIYAEAGQTLVEFSSGKEFKVFNVTNLGVLVGIGLVVLLPSFFAKKLVTEETHSE